MRLGPITIDAVLAVRSSAETNRHGIADDYEGYRHKGRESRASPAAARRSWRPSTGLLGQVGDDDEEQARKVTADYATLHGVLGDVLMEEIRELAVTAGAYWRHEGTIAAIDRQIADIQEHVLLLREAERAADERRADDRDEGADRTS